MLTRSARRPSSVEASRADNCDVGTCDREPASGTGYR